MQPAAHFSAIMDCLTTVFTGWRAERPVPADIILNQYFRSRRYIGAKDRGAIAEPFYWCLRHLASLDWWARQSPVAYDPILPYPPAVGDHARSARLIVLLAILFRGDVSAKQLAGLFNGKGHAPAMLNENEWQAVHMVAEKALVDANMPEWAKLNVPMWVLPELKSSFGADYVQHIEALNREAPVDLRTNTLKISRDALLIKLNEEGFEAGPTDVSPVGIRLKKRGGLFASPLFKAGLFEMQDEASQICALTVDAKPGMRVIDFCAGAGGKTLAIAAQMKNKGRILAVDISGKRLGEMTARLRRSGVDNTQTHIIATEKDRYLKRHAASADRVLADVPCSGVGSWRRNPDLKWRTNKSNLDQLQVTQQSILQQAAKLVKPGGRLIYTTCSLLKCENEQAIDQFLTKYEDFVLVCAQKIWNKDASVGDGHPAYLWLTPHVNHTDGFFTAVLERRKSDSTT